MPFLCLIIQFMNKLFQKIKNKLLGVKDPAVTFAKWSFAQNGEDIILYNLFQLRGIERPGFVDIGAHHPWLMSNTALLYRHGSRGVHVEANPTLHRHLKAERPYDTHVQAGIGPHAGEMLFYEFADASLSTFSEAEAQRMQAVGQTIANTYTVPVITAQQLIDQYCNARWPSLLCIDVEGYDDVIMDAIHFEHPNSPLVICAETAAYHPQGHGEKRTAYMQAIQQKGYVLWADTNLNSIFIRQDFWD